MRILSLAAIILICFYFLKIDMAEGTIPLAAFYSKEVEACSKNEESVEMTSIAVQTLPGDTIYTLFALYPAEGKSFIERLSDFYKLNPHLQNQDFAYGETLQLPIYQSLGSCQ
ncbi:hypothetical protein ACFOZY_11840 [Chungangia koreensis]|uniref:LysM domain-containing protein n=1 Tax=Chungangia koreensis TaxID=752657 RepID=A0ABV8XAE5_9LACT